MNERSRNLIVFTAVAAGAGVTTFWSLMTILVAPPYFGLDLTAYVEGARRLVTTGTPYSPELHEGTLEHVISNIRVAYLYPPPLAQLFVPLSVIPMPYLAWVWTFSQVVILGCLVLLLIRANWTTAPPRMVALIVLATVAFQPTQVALFIGNVSGWIAILVAVVLLPRVRERAFASAALAWLKITPGAFALGAILDRDTRRAAVVSLGALLILSLVISPYAWIDFLAVLPSLMSMPVAPYPINLAPGNILDLVGANAYSWVARWTLPAAFMVLTIANAFSRELVGWVAAACGVYLTLNGTTWLQYFIVLVPLAIVAWPKASAILRALVFLIWFWYGPFWFASATEWHKILGLVFWVGALAWISVRPFLNAPRPRPAPADLDNVATQTGGAR